MKDTAKAAALAVARGKITLNDNDDDMGDITPDHDGQLGSSPAVKVLPLILIKSFSIVVLPPSVPVQMILPLTPTMVFLK